MKRLFGIVLALALLVASPAFAVHQLVDLPLNSTTGLTDKRGNLTAGALVRNSDATYVNTSGVLSYSRGSTRSNLLLWSEDTSQAGTWSGSGPWVQTKTLTVSLTYILSVHKAGVTLTLAAGTGAYTVLSGTTATYGSPVVFTMTTGGTVTVSTDTANPKCQLEQLPSGNVIGSDLMDQEALTARTSGYTLVVGTIYKIVSRATLDFTTVGAANNTAGTYFICHTAAALGAGDAASDVTAPAKGSFHGTAMLAGSTELIANGGFETITDAGPPVNFGTWAETVGGTDTITDPGAGYLGSHAACITKVDSGSTNLNQNVSVTAGKLYKLEFYSKGDGTTQGRYAIYNQTASAWILGYTNTGNATTTYAKTTKYFVAPTGCSQIKIFLTATSAASGAATFDYVSVRQVQTTWTRVNTNTMEIDEAEGSGGALKITWVDGTSGAVLTLRDIMDMTADLVVGETYQVTFKMKVTGTVGCGVYNGAAPYATLATTGTVSPASLTSYTLYFKATATNTEQIYFSAMGSGDVVWIDDLTIKAVPDLAYLSPGSYKATSGSAGDIPAEPRFEANGLLVEGEGTNLNTYSNATSSNTADWSLNRTTGTYSQSDPVGGTDAFLITETATTGLHYIYGRNTALIQADAQVVTGSVFVKKGSTARDWAFVGVRQKDGTVKYAFANISTGAIGTITAGCTGNIIPLSNGWYRIWISTTTGTGTTNSGAAVLAGMTTADNTTSHAGDTNYSMYSFGHQLEATAYPTSYIPTNGCPVTRLTEAGSATNGYSWTMSTALKNSLGAASPSRGTMLVDFVPGYSENNAAHRGIVTPVDSNIGLLYHTAAGSNLRSYDGANAANWGAEALTLGRSYVLAVRWDSSVAAPTTGALKVSEKHGGTWTHGTATNYDGAFTLGTSLRLGYSNEYPFWIKNVKFYDGWVPDNRLNFPMGAWWEYRHVQ